VTETFREAFDEKVDQYITWFLVKLYLEHAFVEDEVCEDLGFSTTIK